MEIMVDEQLITLDRIDRRILKELQENGRITNTELQIRNF